MTSNRFADRERLVLDEANAIGTCYLRAGLVDATANDEIRATLRQYTDLRLKLFEQGLDREAYQRNAAKMDELLGTLWSAVEGSARRQPDLTRNSLIVPAANEVIDLSSTRAWSVRYHVPGTVIVLLALCMIASGALTGQSFGQVGSSGKTLWLVQNLLAAMVIFVVLDFDRPRRGLIQVDHTPFVELKAGMNR